MKIVIDKGIAGLGNRLRCVAATIEYAKKTDRQVYIDWSDGMFATEGINAFNKYFKIVNYPHIKDSTCLDCKTFYPSVYSKIPLTGNIYDYYTKRQLSNRLVRKGLHILFRGLHKIGNQDLTFDIAVCKASLLYQSFVLIEKFQNQFSETGQFAFGAHLNRNIDADAVVYCDNIPFYSPITLRDHVALQPEYKQMVDSFVEKYELDKDAVSVHVRKSGKKCYGNLEKFIKNLKQFIVENDVKRVFLCTDNNETEELFKTELGNMLIKQDKLIPVIKSGETGIHDYARNIGNEELKSRLTEEAVLDMFIMSRTKYLFYQLGSTFSEISKVYQQSEFISKSWASL
jgi:hypothetical protein